MTKKQQRRPPSFDDGSSQENIPASFRVTSENTHPDLVELPFDLLVFLCPKLYQLLCVTRVDAYGPTQHRAADAARLQGHAPLNSTPGSEKPRSPPEFSNGCGSPQNPKLKATELRILGARTLGYISRVSTHVRTAPLMGLHCVISNIISM